MEHLGGIIKLGIKYPVFKALDTKKAVQHYGNLLGLTSMTTVPMFDAVIVRDGLSVENGFVLVNDDSCISYTVLLTANCIHETLRLKNSGFTCIEHPVATDMGLASKFRDEFGNMIILLEERDYD